LSSLYGVWEKEKFAEPSIIESYEPDRTKVVVEFEADESELGVKKQEVREKTREVGVENAEVGVKTQEVVVEASELGVNPDFDVLMGAYRNDFRANARKVLSALAEHPEMDFVRLSQVLNLSQNSVWRAVRALREVGLLVREGADKGGKWIVKK
jgi:predicted HTH transcriptional regulator